MVNDFTVPCSASSTCATSWLMIGSSKLGGHQINQRENEHPDQIDEVPVEPRHLDILILELAARYPDRNDGEVDDPDHYVRHMKPSDPEESRAEERLAPFVRKRRHVLVVDQIQPLGEMQSDERGPAGDGAQYPTDRGLAVSVMHGADRHHHGQTAREQAEGHEARKD